MHHPRARDDVLKTSQANASAMARLCTNKEQSIIETYVQMTVRGSNMQQRVGAVGQHCAACAPALQSLLQQVQMAGISP